MNVDCPYSLSDILKPLVEYVGRNLSAVLHLNIGYCVTEPNPVQASTFKKSLGYAHRRIRCIRIFETEYLDQAISLWQGKLYRALASELS